MIRHTVVFTLKHPPHSLEERRFLTDAKRILTAIKGVTHFERERWVPEVETFLEIDYVPLGSVV